MISSNSVWSRSLMTEKLHHSWLRFEYFLSDSFISVSFLSELYLMRKKNYVTDICNRFRVNISVITARSRLMDDNSCLIK